MSGGWGHVYEEGGPRFYHSINGNIVSYAREEMCGADTR